MLAPAQFEPVTPCGWSREQVQKFASDVAAHFNYRPKEDIERLVQRLGGQIKNSDWTSARETGSITVYDRSHFVISLSPLSGWRRSRFTIAHELGHYFLHSKMGEKKIRVGRDGSGQVEWEANWFAAGFLMPETKFRELMHRYGDAQLAEQFGVSEEAVRIRKESLS